MAQTVWRLDLHPSGGEFDVASRQPEFYGGKYSTSDRWEVLEVLARTISTEAQKMVSRGSGEALEGLRIWTGTDFRVLRDRQTGERAFAKRIRDNPVQQMREFALLEAVDHPRFVRLLEVHCEYGLVFPYLPWQPLREIDFRRIANREEFRNEVVGLYDCIRSTTVHTGLMDPSPGPTPGSTARLDRLIDLNIHNFLVRAQGNRVVEWTAIDLEPGWVDRTKRNRSNERKALRLIDGSRFGSGLWRRLRGIFRSSRDPR
jgi:hypothetical protein